MKFGKFACNTPTFNLSVLKDDNINRNDIDDKIKTKYFDFIIFGSVGPDESISMNNMVNDDKFKHYNSNEKIFIFGGDRSFNMITNNNSRTILENISKKGICFVRELDYSTDYFNDKVWNEYAKDCKYTWDKNILKANNILHNR